MTSSLTPSLVQPPTAPGALRSRWLALALLAASLLLVPLGTGVGSMGLENLWPALFDQHADPGTREMAWQIVWDIRLPRTLGAWCAGAGTARKSRFMRRTASCSGPGAPCRS